MLGSFLCVFQLFHTLVPYFFIFIFCSSQVIPLQSPAIALGNSSDRVLTRGVAPGVPVTVLGPYVLRSGSAVVFEKRAGDFQPCRALFSCSSPLFPPPSLCHCSLFRRVTERIKELKLSGWEKSALFLISVCA